MSLCFHLALAEHLRWDGTAATRFKKKIAFARANKAILVLWCGCVSEVSMEPRRSQTELARRSLLSAQTEALRAVQSAGSRGGDVITPRPHRIVIPTKQTITYHQVDPTRRQRKLRKVSTVSVPLLSVRGKALLEQGKLHKSTFLVLQSKSWHEKGLNIGACDGHQHQERTRKKRSVTYRLGVDDPIRFE